MTGEYDEPRGYIGIVWNGLANAWSTVSPILWIGVAVVVAVVVIALLIAIPTFPLWAYYFDLVTFEWIVVIGLTMLLLFSGESNGE